jgi:hypothetical protein
MLIQLSNFPLDARLMESCGRENAFKIIELTDSCSIFIQLGKFVVTPVL